MYIRQRLALWSAHSAGCRSSGRQTVRALRHVIVSTEAPGNLQQPLFPLPHCDGISARPGVFTPVCQSSVSSFFFSSPFFLSLSLLFLQSLHVHAAGETEGNKTGGKTNSRASNERKERVLMREKLKMKHTHSPSNIHYSIVSECAQITLQ